MTIEVNYATLEHAAGQMKTLSGQIDEKLDALRAKLQQLDWQGSDREAYDTHQRKWDESIKDLNTILNQIGAAVGVAKQNYMDTENSNANLW
ncbi:WXG100 family type VII secretion target [Longispora albida]|uniref:WXG100 family type VII secretion target n=1 Tax=Longispora albida TaxID=203523 RepID=UPI00038050B6|nr:WXG100 family type VII secretion target [Longispora albida]